MADLKTYTHPLRVGMPGAKALKCMDRTAVPTTREEAGKWIADDAETLGYRRAILGDALRDALPDLAKEVMAEREDWKAIYHKGAQVHEYRVPSDPRKFPTTPRVREFLTLLGVPDLLDQLHDKTETDPDLVIDFETTLDSMKGEAIAALEGRKRGGR